jgi:hypothetical protein
VGRTKKRLVLLLDAGNAANHARDELGGAADAEQVRDDLWGGGEICVYIIDKCRVREREGGRGTGW